jgi:hypothetical protein
MRLGGLNNVDDEKLWRRVVLHEFGHVLGLQHEHQNPNAGIKWKLKAVEDYYVNTVGWTNTDAR